MKSSNKNRYKKRAVSNEPLNSSLTYDFSKTTTDNLGDLIDYLETKPILNQSLNKTKKEQFKDFLEYLEIKPIEIKSTTDETLDKPQSSNQTNYDCKTYPNLPRIDITFIAEVTNENVKQIYNLHSEIDLGIVNLEY